MRAFVRGVFALTIAFGATGLAAAAGGPAWEKPKLHHFLAKDCTSGSATVDQIQLKREEASDTAGFASYTDSTQSKGYEHGAGGWVLKGDVLTVAGDGFVLEGHWTGAALTATITRQAGGEPLHCRYGA
jgi:hypothetical protein